ncbi:MAG TPA: ABC transporter permease [Acidimicrobiales bacterium]|nr:ABC transporter permease [Acidimicrobiales bacterium]
MTTTTRPPGRERGPSPVQELGAGVRSARKGVGALVGHPTFGPYLRPTVGLAALVVVLKLVMHNNEPPLGEFAYGVIFGLLYALLAFGIILIYRANRIINFAQAEMGSVAALLGVLLIKLHHWPYLGGLAVAVIAGMLSGALVEVLVMRRFSKAPRLVLSVVTIAVGLIFAALQFFLPKWLGGSLQIDPNPPKTPFSGLHFYLAPVHFDANAIVILFAAAAVMIGLSVFFKRTSYGMAVRAAAENADRARLLGISPNLLSTIVWVIAGLLSTLGVFLRIPIVGLPVGADIGPQVLLYALAAAVIAKMESFSTALWAGIAIGITDSTVYYFSHDPSLAEALMLPTLLVAMLLQRSKVSRGQDSGMATWSLAAEFRPVPPELRALPEVVWTRLVGGVAVVGLLVALPYLVHVEQQILASVVVIYGIVAVSLVILTGWAGQISLGQWGFVGVGAAVASAVSVHLRHTAFIHGDFFAALILAGLAGAVASVIIGLPALRIQGLYLAVTTLAFALAVQVFLLSPTYFPELLPQGLSQIERPLLYGRYSLHGPRAFYFFCLVVLGLALGSARALRRSRAGRVIIAARDNEKGAAAYGVSIRVARLSAFAISGFWASVAGALFAYQEQGVNNNAFPLTLSETMLIIVVIGGLTSLPGAMLGTAFIGILQYGGLGANAQLLASGVGVLLLLFLFPGGLAQIAYGARDNLLRSVAVRRRILVPSLLADQRAEADNQAFEAQAMTTAMGQVLAAPEGTVGAERDDEPVAGGTAAAAGGTGAAAGPADDDAGRITGRFDAVSLDDLDDLPTDGPVSPPGGTPAVGARAATTRTRTRKADGR